ncbi:hypothetical protein, partial [Phenylobacterium sp.]|uniref:hypothetical protein n=1 Tax=Phenylobacterium sp. TaxID=1871053 RepID=UPI0025D0C2FE
SLNHPITDLGIPPDSQRRETALIARQNSISMPIVIAGVMLRQMRRGAVQFTSPFIPHCIGTLSCCRSDALARIAMAIDMSPKKRAIIGTTIEAS